MVTPLKITLPDTEYTEHAKNEIFTKTKKVFVDMGLGNFINDLSNHQFTCESDSFKCPTGWQKLGCF